MPAEVIAMTVTRTILLHLFPAQVSRTGSIYVIKYVESTKVTVMIVTATIGFVLLHHARGDLFPARIS